MRIGVAVLAGLAVAAASSPAGAGAKDETAADWLPIAPPGFNDWRARLADRGISFGATYIVDNIANVSGGMKQGGITFGRLDAGVDVDVEKLAG